MLKIKPKMFNTFKLLNKYTLEIVELSIDLKVKLYPAYYIVIEPIQLKTDLGDCSICLNKLDSDIHKTDCNHLYHRKCYEEWLNYNTKCPLCRTDNKYIILSHNRNITYIEGDLTIPVREFVINLGYTYLKFDKDAFIKLYKSSPALWLNTTNSSECKSILEPVFKLGNIYISYFLRNTILFGNEYEINNIITSNEIYKENVLLYLDCENEKYNKGILSRKNFRILYEWIYDVMSAIRKEKQIEYQNIMNTQILNIMCTYIYYNNITRREYQKLACIAMYLVHDKKLDLDFFEYISDFTYNVKELQEFSDKVESIV